VAMDASRAGKGRLAMTWREPLGVIGAITPWNVPLNLAMHKVATALAAGNSVVHKPSEITPLSAIAFARLAAAEGCPPGAYNVITGEGEEIGQAMVGDPRIRMITFTGSAKAGWDIRARAGTRRVALELGGNAAVIVARDADLALAARRCAAGGYMFAGQSCISVQRILVEQPVYGRFLELFVGEVEALKTGDPLDPETWVGPMIDEHAAARAESWIAEAVREGARIETGGSRRGTLLVPTVLTGTSPAQRVNCEEIFAPVTTVSACADLDEAIAVANDSPYGLQAGVFSNDVNVLMKAWSALDVGAVIGNDIPGYRIDRMPYGGSKASGLGREGVRYAIDEMTELRLLTLPGA